jgi:hypothetical protein
MSTEWVVMFDNEGLDTLIPWTELKHERVIGILSGELPRSEQHIISRTILRAQMNPQRKPEIWGFNTSSDISEDDMLQMWQESPQGMADLVRENGNQPVSYTHLRAHETG